MHKNTKGSGVRAKCVHCHIVLNRPNDKEMNQHYQIYTQRNLKLNNHQCTQKWADMESVSFDSVSAMEIKTQKKRQEFMPGYRSTYISMPNGLQRYGECQVCKCLIEPPSLEKHRCLKKFFHFSKQNQILSILLIIFFTLAGTNVSYQMRHRSS